MVARPQTRRLIAEEEPKESVLDGGPARSKELDREVFETLERLLGGPGPVRQLAKASTAGPVSFLEADWAATEHHLWYVHYHAEVTHRWRWDSLRTLGAAGGGWFGATTRIRFTTSTRTHQLSLGKAAARRLLAISATHLLPQQ